MIIEIPGYQTLDLEYLVLDYNGTIAIDGKMPDTVKQRLRTLAEHLKIYILTADTHGTAKENCQGLPVQIQTFPGSNAMAEKMNIVGKLSPSAVWQWETGEMTPSCSRPAGWPSP